MTKRQVNTCRFCFQWGLIGPKHYGVLNLVPGGLANKLGWKHSHPAGIPFITQFTTAVFHGVLANLRVLLFPSPGVYRHRAQLFILSTWF